MKQKIKDFKKKILLSEKKKMLNLLSVGVFRQNIPPPVQYFGVVLNGSISLDLSVSWGTGKLDFKEKRLTEFGRFSRHTIL